MSRHPLVPPRSAVIAAAAVLVALAILFVARVSAVDRAGALSAAPPRPQAAPAVASSVPEPKPVAVDRLAIPCWSCPGAEELSLRFRTDLDQIAPLGTGERNAAEWLAAFTKSNGRRAAEAEAIMARRVDHPKIGKILPADDPLLLEAQPWVDQATMRFFPDVYPVEGFSTPIPNLLLALTLARSWLARGEAAGSFEDALLDFRRVVRLGRLLRQEDVLVIDDLVGLAVIRMGAEAIYDRSRSEGRLDLALAAAVVAGEAPAQKLLSAARMTSAEVVPYLRRGAQGSTIAIPDGRFEGLRKIALTCPDRRFRVEACVSLTLVASFGSEEQREKAREALKTLAASSDAIVASAARWHLANPVDEKRLDRLLAQDK